MVVKNTDISHNDITGKQYSRTLYWCDVDDIWVSIEIPKDDRVVSK